MNFTLRPIQRTDLDSLLHHANNPNIAGMLTNRFPYPYTRADGEKFIEFVQAAKPNTSLAIDIDGNMVGAIGVHQQMDVRCKNAEMGYWLTEPFWGKGIMTRAVVQMLDYGFQNFDITRIYACVFEGNEGSKKVLLKAGFEFEGHFSKTIWKNGVALDETVYGYRVPAT